MLDKIKDFLDDTTNWEWIITALLSVISIVITIWIAFMVKSAFRLSKFIDKKILKRCLLKKEDYYGARGRKSETVNKWLPIYGSSLSDDNVFPVEGKIKNKATSYTNLTFYKEKGRMCFLNFQRYNELVVDISEFLKNLFNTDKNDKYPWRAMKVIKRKIKVLGDELCSLKDKVVKINVNEIEYPSFTKKDREKNDERYLTFFYSWIIPEVKENSENKSIKDLYMRLSRFFNINTFSSKRDEATIARSIFDFRFELYIGWKESEYCVNAFEEFCQKESEYIRGNDQQKWTKVMTKKFFCRNIKEIFDKENESNSKLNYFDLKEKSTTYSSKMTRVLNHIIVMELYRKNDTALKLDKLKYADDDKVQLYSKPRYEGDIKHGHGKYIFYLGKDDNFTHLKTLCRKEKQEE